MGLDLIVESCPKPGHEIEWREILERAFASPQDSDADVARFQEISIPAFERLDAPRVGYDTVANDWIVELRKVTAPDEITEVLREFHGHYALPLVKSDGLPPYTHAGRYEGVDETSFRGSFLKMCDAVLTNKQIDDAWNHRFPEAAIAYGCELLDAAKLAAENPPPAPAPQKKGFLSKLGLGKSTAPEATFEEQLQIVEAAGAWFVFWGERGHAIRAWC